MFEIFLTILHQFMVANTFTYFAFSRNHTFRKIDILPFLTVSSSFGLLIVCKFEEWKRFAQLLVGKPTLPKLHVI